MSESTNPIENQLSTESNEIQYSINSDEMLTNIRKHFDISELRDLCFKLNIDYENLNGQNKRDKTRSLVETCNRKNRLLHLALFCQSERPDIAWLKTQEIQQITPNKPTRDSVRDKPNEKSERRARNLPEPNLREVGMERT